MTMQLRNAIVITLTLALVCVPRMRPGWAQEATPRDESDAVLASTGETDAPPVIEAAPASSTLASEGTHPFEQSNDPERQVASAELSAPDPDATAGSATDPLIPPAPGQLLPAPPSFDDLIKDLGNDDFETRERASAALAAAGPQATNQIVAALGDPDPEVRARAFRLLDAVGPDGLPGIVDAMNNHPTFHQIGDEARPILMKALEHPDRNASDQALTLLRRDPRNWDAINEIIYRPTGRVGAK